MPDDICSSGCSCRPRVSAEIFSVPLDEARFLIYAPLRRAAFVANRAAVNLIADLKSGRYAPAGDPGGALLKLLRSLRMADAEPEELPIQDFEGTPAPVAVTLFMTTACNLRCTYCYASAGDTPQKFMSFDVAKRAIDFVASNAAAQGTGFFEVGYHGGGEATVNWPVMVESLAYAQRRADELAIQVSAGAATNGMLNDAQISWFVKNLSGATISLDGAPEVQDANRPVRTGKGSSARVARALRAFDEAGFPYDLRLTVTAKDVGQLPDSVGYILAQFKPRHVQVEPVYRLGRGQDGPSAETAEFVEAFRVARAIARDHGLDLEYSAARLDVLTNHFCGVSQDSFCVSPDGNVSACYEAFSEDTKWGPVFFYGRPRDGEATGYEFDMRKLSHLRKQAVQHHSYCQGCFAKWHCAGDCYHKSLKAGPGEEFRGSGRCEVTRALTQDLIIERIIANGGLVWNGLDCCANGGQTPFSGAAASPVLTTVPRSRPASEQHDRLSPL